MNIEHEVISHEPVFTLDEMVALNLPKAEHVAKNLFVRMIKRNYFLFVVREEISKAGLVEDVEYHRWSSYNEYIKKGRIIDCSLLLEMFNDNKERSIQDFINLTIQ